MKLQLGPLTITMVQLFLLACGLGISMVIWNSLNQAGVGKVFAAILALPVFLIFLFIAFFRLSELSLLPFVTKLIRTYFFDEPKKFQINYKKVDPIEVDKQIVKSGEKKNIVHTKKGKIDKENLDKLEGF